MEDIINTTENIKWVKLTWKDGLMTNTRPLNNSRVFIKTKDGCVMSAIYNHIKNTFVESDVFTTDETNRCHTILDSEFIESWGYIDHSSPVNLKTEEYIGFGEAITLIMNDSDKCMESKDANVILFIKNGELWDYVKATDKDHKIKMLSTDHIIDNMWKVIPKETIKNIKTYRFGDALQIIKNDTTKCMKNYNNFAFFFQNDELCVHDIDLNVSGKVCVVTIENILDDKWEILFKKEVF